jgi:hypothetical protein
MPKCTRLLGRLVLAAAGLGPVAVLPGCSQPRALLDAPVIQCHCKDPTADKPQSKVWFARGRWWAWLRWGKSGGRLWRREGRGGWLPQEHLDALLSALPGRADVWADADNVVAALVEGKRLAVAALIWSPLADRYELAAFPVCWQAASAVETVTIDRDADGAFWAAYPLNAKKGRTMVVRKFPPGLGSPSGQPIPLANVGDRDDICAVAALAGGVGVMWSDQKAQTVSFRRHLLGAADADWAPAEVVASGCDTADDHINFCRPRGASDLKLIAATKTSLDTIGCPILALRVLTADDQWRSLDFAEPTDELEFTRPIVLWLVDRPAALFTTRSQPPRGRRGGPRFSIIEMLKFAPDVLSWRGPRREVIRAAALVNNVTGPKTPPPGRACLVLASDGDGGVYEALVGPAG